MAGLAGEAHDAGADREGSINLLAPLVAKNTGPRSEIVRVPWANVRSTGLAEIRSQVAYTGSGQETVVLSARVSQGKGLRLTLD